MVSIIFTVFFCLGLVISKQDLPLLADENTEINVNSIGDRFGENSKAYNEFLEIDSRGMKKGYKSVISEFQSLLNRYPGKCYWKADVEYRIGLGYRLSGKYVDAQRVLLEMIASNPEHPYVSDALVELGQTFFLQGRGAQKAIFENSAESLKQFQHGIRNYSKVVNQYPKAKQASRAQYMIGSTYLFMNKQDEALSAYDKVIKHYEGSYQHKAMFKSAEILSDYGRIDEAARLYNRIESECKIQSLAKKTQKKSLLVRLLGTFAMNLDVSEWLGEEPIDVDQSLGKVVFIVFWSTWCPSCKKEIPHLNKLYKEFSATDLVMLSITKNSRGQTTEKVKSFIENRGVKFPVGIDDKGISSSSYWVSGIPAGVIIDKNGIIRWRDNTATLSKSFLKKLLSE